MAQGDVLVKLRGDKSDLKRALSSSEQDVRAYGNRVGGHVQKGMRDASDATLSWGQTVTAAIGGVLGAAAIQKSIRILKNFFSTAISGASSLEGARIAFTTFTGSAEKANQVLAELKTFAIETPYEMNELRAGARNLLAFKVSAEDVVPTMRMLGDVASGVGVNLNELTELYGKFKVQGRIRSDDIFQLSGRGINIIPELAKQLGVADDAVLGLVSKGQVSFANIQAGLQAMTSEGGAFFNMMKAQSESLSGRWSTLKDEFAAIIVSIGEKFMPALKAVTDVGIAFASRLRGGVEVLSKHVDTLIARFQALAPPISALQSVWETLRGHLMEQIEELTERVVLWGMAFKAVWDAVKGPIAGLLRYLFGAGTTFGKIFLGWKKVIDDFVKEGLLGFVVVLENWSDSVQAATLSAALAIVKAWNSAKEALINYSRELQGLPPLAFAVDPVEHDLSKRLDEVSERLGTKLEEKRDELKRRVDAIMGSIAGFSGSLAEGEEESAKRAIAAADAVSKASDKAKKAAGGRAGLEELANKIAEAAAGTAKAAKEGAAKPVEDPAKPGPLVLPLTKEDIASIKRVEGRERMKGTPGIGDDVFTSEEASDAGARYRRQLARRDQHGFQSGTAVMGEEARKLFEQSQKERVERIKQDIEMKKALSDLEKLADIRDGIKFIAGKVPLAGALT